MRGWVGMHLKAAKYTPSPEVSAAAGGRRVWSRLLAGGSSTANYNTDNNNNNGGHTNPFTVGKQFAIGNPLASVAATSQQVPANTPTNTSKNKGSRRSAAANSTNGTLLANPAYASATFLTLESLPIANEGYCIEIENANENENEIENDNNSSKATVATTTTLTAPLASGIASLAGHNGAAFGKHDKMKLMELSIINLVESSALACEQTKCELALALAREALESFSALKALMMQERSAPGLSVQPSRANQSSLAAATVAASQQQQQQTRPVTTNPGLLELGLMVQSNLAARLAKCYSNRQLLEESAELYLQLCKMASNQQSSANLLIGNGPSSVSSSAQQYESKLLLHRFGLNVGNLWFQMRDYQRALKYYRLTLDRFSGHGLSVGQRSLRMKIMHNIALTLLAIKSTDRPNMDAIGALGRLLADNQLSALSQTGGQRDNNSDSSGATTIAVYNANHHSFALNLLVCQRQQGDLNGMMSTMKSLVRVDICHHFERVFQPSNSSGQIIGNEKRIPSVAHALDGQPEIAGARQTIGTEPEIVPYDAFTSAASRLSTQASGSANSKQRQVEGRQGLGSTLLATNGIEFDQGQQLERVHVIDWSESVAAAVAVADNQRQPFVATDETGEQTSRQFLSAAEKRRQVMSCIRADRLEHLIGNKRAQVSRSILMGCKLMLDLGGYDRGHELAFGANGNAPTSVFDFCLKLLNGSNTCHRWLAADLKTNSVVALLKACELNEAVCVLKKIESEQQQPHESTVESDVQRKSLASDSSAPASAVVASNLSLLYLLEGQTKHALELAKQALSSIGTNTDMSAECLVNLADCYYHLDELQLADNIYRQALTVGPNNWRANYNSALVNRRLGRELRELPNSTRLALDTDRQQFTRLLSEKLVLSLIQLALLHQQSGNVQQALAIFNDLLTINARQAPEIHLLASKLIDDSGKESARVSGLNILQQANRDHPYHLPVVERLVALNIRDFNYEAAITLLTTSIKNRPDQVKWYQMLAECQRRATDYNKAIATYKIAIEIFPQDTSCLRALVKLADELGLNEERKICEIKLERVIRKSQESLRA